MSLFDDILKGVGLGVNVGAQTGLFGPSTPKQPKAFTYPLKDSGQMSAVLDQIWLTQWNPAKAQLPPDQLLQVAQSIRTILYDPATFQQSGTENDAYLNNSKKSIDDIIAGLQSQLALNGNSAAVTAALGASAGVMQIGGLTITPNVLLYGAVGAIVLGLVLSRK